MQELSQQREQQTRLAQSTLLYACDICSLNQLTSYSSHYEGVTKVAPAKFAYHLHVQWYLGEQRPTTCLLDDTVSLEKQCLMSL
jgi:hypothetical protein